MLDARGSGAFISANAKTLKVLSNEMLFDYLGVGLNAAKAEGETMVINWHFTDSNQRIALNLDNSALTK